jgi:hypothetical protein
MSPFQRNENNAVIFYSDGRGLSRKHAPGDVKSFVIPNWWANFEHTHMRSQNAIMGNVKQHT